MNTRVITAALAVSAILTVGGCKNAKDKLATAAAATDTVAAVPDTAANTATYTLGTFTDSRDGNVYRIVEIGRQTWYAENLNYAADGSVCYENSPDSCAKYGRLYDWNTAMTACPAGTHLPTNDEWTTLMEFIGGESKAGTKLKSSMGWIYFNGIPAGTDDYGFSALPGGKGGSNGNFWGSGDHGHWWSATKDTTTQRQLDNDEGDLWITLVDINNLVWTLYIYHYVQDVGRSSEEKNRLLSVRCVQND